MASTEKVRIDFVVSLRKGSALGLGLFLFIVIIDVLTEEIVE